ncbi:MAG TPA: immunoglobulin domain-containing protein, partial [Verrucomicrobiota bacterium]|nr:immunoglobulin domain-containing protein [Verrucomicrobiota bacterium]
VLIGDGLGEASTLRLVGAENKLLANRSVMGTLWIEGTVNWGAAKLTVEPGAENRGVIHLETSSNDAWDRGSRVDCGVAGLVNAAGGVIRAVAGAGDQRHITGRVINRGRIEAEAETEFVGTLDAAGGICAGALLIHDSDILVTGSPPEPTSLLLEGGANRLLTGNLPNTELWLRGNTRFGAAVVTVVGSVTNEGVIRLDTTGIDYRQQGSQLVAEAGVLHNGPGGTLRLAAGVGGPRSVTAALVNDGTVEFDIAGSVGSSRARHANRGTLRLNGVTATFSGLTFENETAGRITGTGTLNVSALRFSNGGTLAPGAPIGLLALTGILVQNPAGVVEIDLAGSESGPVHDRLAVSDEACLEGLLRLERLEGFVPELGSSFAVVTHTAPYGRFRQVEGTAVGDELRFDVTYQPTQVMIETVSASTANEQAPTIVRQPASQEVVQGRPAWFGVTVNGATPLGYQWQLNEIDLPGATGSVLHLPAVSSADAGAYRVLVENAYGSVTSAPATLVVQQSIGTFVALAEAGAAELPVVPGDGVRIEVFNDIGGGQTPAPAHLDGVEPDGTTLSPFIDFPRPGATVAVGTSFNRFFAETTTPPEQVSGLSAANFILRHHFHLRVSRDLDLDTDTPAIDVQLGVGSDDGFHLAVGSVFIGSAGDRGFAYTYRTVSFEEEGLYPVTLLFAANTAGSSGLEFAWETAVHGTVIVPQSVLYRSPTPGQHLITFEELPAGTVISNQFAGEGILFETVSGNPQVTADRPDKFVPISPPHVYADVTLEAAAPIEIELRFVEPATGRSATVDFLSFFVIDAEETGAEVTAFDPTGAEVFRQEYHGGGAAQEQVRIEAPRLFRVRVHLGEGADTAAVDHVTFGAPQPIADQSFRIAIGDGVIRDIPEPGAGVLEFAGEIDEYTFATVAGQPVFFDDHDSSTRRLFWELYSPENTLLFRDRLDGSDPGAFVPDRTGDCRILVLGENPASDTGTYAFKLWSEMPSIQRHPSSLTVYVGQDATFSVLAESGLPLTYQWRLNGADLPGATQPVLTLSRVRPDQAGSYSVRVSNAVGPVESEPAMLTVDSNVADLAVLGIRGPATGRPGELVELTWAVTNTGIAAAVAPWTETILLSGDDVPGNDQVVALFEARDTLPAGMGRVRTHQVTIPRLGAAGTLWFLVRVDSGNQVPESDESDNVAVAIEPIAVTPVLTLQLSRDTVAEESSVQASLSRNGNLASPLAVALTASDTSEINVPAEAVIPSGRETVWFTVSALSDGVVDGDQPVVVEAAANGYLGAQANLVVRDVDVPRLALTLADTNLVEGDSLRATLALTPPMGRDLTVTIESSNPDQLTAPGSALILAGQRSAEFNLEAIDDAWLEATACYTLSAFAPGLSPVAATVCVIDHDAPALAFEVARPSVSEADGPLATTATLTRDPRGAIPIQFELESSDRSEILVPPAVTIPAGAAASSFPVSAVDDTLVDGAQTVQIRAFLLETASGRRLGPPLVVPIDVTDNEAPGLTLTLDRDWVPEGLAPAAAGTVSRNPVTETALEVQLAADRPAEAAVPAAIVIPAGQASATFEIVSLDDEVADGNQNVVITAQAPGLGRIFSDSGLG